MQQNKTHFSLTDNRQTDVQRDTGKNFKGRQIMGMESSQLQELESENYCEDTLSIKLCEKRLFEGEVVSAQLRSSAHNLKANKEKQAYSRLVGQTILKKYRMLSKANWLITRRMQRWRASPNASPLVFL